MNKKQALVAVYIAVVGLFSCSEDVMPVPQASGGTVADTATTVSQVTQQQQSDRSGDFYFGVTGQPLSVAPYTSIPAEKQVELINSMGMNIYRFGIEYQIKSGEVTVPYLYKPLRKATTAGKLTLLPLIKARTLNFDKTEEENYQNGLDHGTKLATWYKDDLTYYEIGNEHDNTCIIRGTANAGIKVSDYDGQKLRIIAATLKGMADGIKAIDADAQIIVNAGWMHTGYMDKMIELGVPIDIIGWHWYSDMEKNAEKTYGITDIGQYLYERYKKTIWFTEFNLKANSDGTPMNEADQQAFIDSFLSKCKKNPHVGAAVIWELLDQPHRTPDERNYGIATYVDNASNSFLPKIFAKTYSTLFN